MIDYRVYTFLEVCKTMNYTKASEALNITQPNVTQHIRWLEHLSGLPLIIRESGSGSREILESILKSRNYTYDNFGSVMEIGDMAAIKEFAADGRGITFIYETAVRRELDAGRLIKLPLEDLHITHDFCMVWLKTGQFRSSFEALAARLLP